MNRRGFLTALAGVAASGGTGLLAKAAPVGAATITARRVTSATRIAPSAIITGTITAQELAANAILAPKITFSPIDGSSA